MKSTLFALGLMACSTNFVDCPPGAFINEWQVISDSKSTAVLDCPRQMHIKLADHGSVWISSTKYRHDAGPVILGVVVAGCDSHRKIVLTAGTTTKPVQTAGDYYSLSAEVVDPWLVAVGVETDVACQAVVNHIEYQLTSHHDMMPYQLPDMAQQDLSAAEDL